MKYMLGSDFSNLLKYKPTGEDVDKDVAKAFLIYLKEAVRFNSARFSVELVSKLFKKTMRLNFSILSENDSSYKEKMRYYCQEYAKLFHSCSSWTESSYYTKAGRAFNLDQVIKKMRKYGGEDVARDVEDLQSAWVSIRNHLSGGSGRALIKAIF